MRGGGGSILNGHCLNFSFFYLASPLDCAYVIVEISCIEFEFIIVDNLFKFFFWGGGS